LARKICSKQHLDCDKVNDSYKRTRLLHVSVICRINYLYATLLVSSIKRLAVIVICNFPHIVNESE